MTTSNIRPNWIYPQSLPEHINKEFSSFPPPFRQILYSRGFKSLDKTLGFLNARRTDSGYSPDLSGVDDFIKILEKAQANKTKITIYGDYDVDGLTSAALLFEALETVGVSAEIYIPDRAEEGYGLNKKAIKNIAANGTGVIITVDCGIRAVPEIKFGKKLGLAIIVTDHHQPGEVLPPANVIINPHLDFPSDPINYLAGVGVVYKIVDRLSDTFPEILPGNYLEFVALGTIADIVPLRGENRRLVKAGIAQLQQTQRQGIFSLMKISGLEPAQTNSADISFQLAPRLNAAGRLGDPQISLDLLLENDPIKAGFLAQQLEFYNSQRKELTLRVENRAEKLALSSGSSPTSLIAFDPEFHPGVVGIAAGRLTRKYYRPAVVGFQGEQITTASCRSIEEFDLISALDRCQDLLLDYGGHQRAAGFKIENQDVPEFIHNFSIFAQEDLSGQDLFPAFQADALATLRDLNYKLLEFLDQLEPTGEMNPRALFIVENVTASKVKQVGSGQKHLKMVVTDHDVSLDGIGFSLGHLADQIKNPVDIILELKNNLFKEKNSLQANILDIRNHKPQQHQD